MQFFVQLFPSINDMMKIIRSMKMQSALIQYMHVIYILEYSHYEKVMSHPMQPRVILILDCLGLDLD